MKAHKIEHTVQSKHPKISNSILGIVSIFAIFLIVWAVVKDVNSTNQVAILSDTDNLIGQASEALLADTSSGIHSDEMQNAAICKLIVGQTTIYDETTLAASLQVGVSTYYAGNIISVQEINANGCLVDINGIVDYLAVGQVQRVGTVYVTIKEVIVS